jgi:hypothetical protein
MEGELPTEPVESNGRRVRPESVRDHPFRQMGQILDRSKSSGTESDNEIENGVRTAYRVIERYLAEGSEVAMKLGSMSYAPLMNREMNRDDMNDVRERLGMVSSELLANWFELLGVFTDVWLTSSQDTKPKPSTDTAHAQPASSAPPTDTACAVRILGDSRACVVRLRLSHPTSSEYLGCNMLVGVRSRETISSVLTASTTGLAVIELSLASTHPLDTYHGVVIDTRSKEPCGTLSCEVVT